MKNVLIVLYELMMNSVNVRIEELNSPQGTNMSNLIESLCCFHVLTNNAAAHFSNW